MRRIMWPIEGGRRAGIPGVGVGERGDTVNVRSEWQLPPAVTHTGHGVTDAGLGLLVAQLQRFHSIRTCY